MVKVSVILPVYGVAQYIEKCVQSLLSQTLDDTEFIFVDDHGPDNSIELARRAIEGHPRQGQFVFLRPEHNLGAGMARNFAIPQTRGEYVAFVDSDDWVEPRMFEELYAAAMKHGCTDLCCCQMQKAYMDGSKGGVMENPHVGDGPITPEKRAYILTHYVSLFSSFIYRREFLLRNDIRFAEDRSADDSYFISCAWMTAASIAYVDKPFYQYLIRPGSVTTTKDSTKYQKRMAVFDKLMQYAKDRQVYDEFKPEIDFMYLKKGYLSSVTNYIVNSTDPNPAVYETIHDRLVELIPDYRSNKYYKKNSTLRLLNWMLRNMPRLATKAIRFWAQKNNVVS